ncbi:nucleotidyltransferase domain-containing protein [Nibricoccus sp. IMCC34717]|uniref:nucleotidyltransferase domain-containing protein n=1 Tax=Nibricoccus sp. IMCC34717 TaxID=3034021 RepID=UPI00384F86A9
MIEPLTAQESKLIQGVLSRHPHVHRAALFGSRAKGSQTTSSDIDLSLWGDLEPRAVEAVASDLDDLPLPYRFDVLAFAGVKSIDLRAHIERVGIEIYRRS